MAAGGGAYTWVETDEEDEQVRRDGVGEFVHDVGVFTWRSVARGGGTTM